MEQQQLEEELKKLYYDPNDSGSYGGIERLFQSARRANLPNVTREAVRNFLIRQRAYTLHRSARRNFPRNRIFVGRIDQQWQADLAGMH